MPLFETALVMKNILGFTLERENYFAVCSGVPLLFRGGPDPLLRYNEQQTEFTSCGYMEADILLFLRYPLIATDTKQNCNI